MICLPKELTSKFLQAIKSRSLDINDLSKMSSEERRTMFEEVVGKDNAKDVNALFESKLTLKNQQTGMINFIKEVGGLKPEQEKDIISRINNAQEVLKPSDIKSFLADYAAKKVGAEVTTEEAAKIADLAKQASEAKLERNKNTNPETIRAYGRAKGAFGDYLNDLKPGEKMTPTKMLANIATIPQTALTGFLHFSAAGVQLWGSMSTPEFWKGAVEQFKYFASEENYKNAQADISGHPDFPIAERAGLGITSIDGKLNDREEAIQSNLLQKGGQWLSDKTGLPNFLRASSRAFTGYLNYVRFNSFENLLTSARLKGLDVSKGSDIAEQYADVVNSFTGRGKNFFGMDLKQNQAKLNAIFFSPRKMAGAVDMFNPYTYLDPKLDTTAKIAALKRLTGSLAMTASVIALAKVAGATVQANPIATGFGKIKIGNTSIDLTGGNASYLRLIAQLAENKSESSTGKVTQLGGIIQQTSKTGKVSNSPFTNPTRADQALSYIRNHTAPIVSALWNWGEGKNAVGQPVTAKSQAFSTLSPLVTQAFYDMYTNDRQTFNKVWPLLPSIFGFSTQSTPPITKKK